MNTASLNRLGWLPVCLLLAHPVTAQDIVKNSGKPAATCASVAGVLLVHEPGGAWKSLQAGASVPSGSFLVGMPRVELVSTSGNVQARLLADIGNRGPFPVLEAGIVLHDADGADFDVSFKRGLMVLENLKKAGEAKVRLRIGDETWILTMRTPGTKVGLEIFGRHAPGLPTTAPKDDVPTSDLLMLVMSGQAFLDTGKEGMAMRAPPGVARLHWDNVVHEHSFQRLEKLPDALMQFLGDQDSKEFKGLALETAKAAQGDLTTGLDGLIRSDNKLGRQVGLTLAGATDDLARVFGALTQSTDPSTREHAVLVLRNWIGREPGQVGKLQKMLVSNNKLSEVQARNLAHLLLGFTEAERRDSSTYSLLLAYLDHQKQGVRALAHWHLVRLAPAGKDIPYDASAPEEQRRQAVQRWQALIPDGQLPPVTKSQTKPNP